MSLIGFTGHAGLPATTNRLVAQALRSRLVGRSNLVGISLLGPGADQLFSRIVLELGGSLYVVVPASTYRNAFQDKAAQQEYERLCTLASRLEQLPYTESNEHAHMEAGKVLVERCDVLVAVWDG